MSRAALFDVDGTLIDSVPAHAQSWCEAFAKFGKDIPARQIQRHIGKGGDQLMPVFLEPEELARFGEELEAYRSKLFLKRYLPSLRPFPKVRELFLAVRARQWRIALATSAKEDELARYKDLAGIPDLVDAATSRDAATTSKPSPDIFDAALRALGGASAADAVVVGDAPYDAMAAARAGVRSVGLLTGGFTEAELREAGCVAVYKDPADLLARIDQSPLR